MVPTRFEDNNSNYGSLFGRSFANFRNNHYKICNTNNIPSMSRSKGYTYPHHDQMWTPVISTGGRMRTCYTQNLECHIYLNRISLFFTNLTSDFTFYHSHEKTNN